jgi:cell division protein FtsL
MSAMRTSPSRRAPAFGSEGPSRPDLRVVDPTARPARRALVRVVTVLAGLLATAGLFLVVCLHVLLTQGQADLDSLRTRADAESARNRRLRVQVAELESPSRIVSAARERLGMVPPATVIYLSAADPTRPLPPVSSEPLPPSDAAAKTTTATPPTAQAQARTQAKSSSTPTTVRPRTTTPTTARRATPTTNGAATAATSRHGR